MDIQAAIGVRQLDKMEAFQQKRTHLAGVYDRLLSDVPEILRPRVRKDVVHAWHLYPIRLELDALSISRNEFIEDMRLRGIGTSLHFIPIHLHPYYREAFGFKPGDFPVAERVYAGLISLPLYPRMTDADVERVATAIKDIVKASRR